MKESSESIDGNEFELDQDEKVGHSPVLNADEEQKLDEDNSLDANGMLSRIGLIRQSSSLPDSANSAVTTEKDREQDTIVNSKKQRTKAPKTNEIYDIDVAEMESAFNSEFGNHKDRSSDQVQTKMQ